MPNSPKYSPSGLLKVVNSLQLLLFLVCSSCVSWPDATLRPHLAVNLPLASPSYQKATQTSGRWVSGNHVTTYVNGHEFYPAMTQAMASAQKSICLETFAFIDSEITRETCRILSQKARSGISVHLILDAIGSQKIGKKNKHLLQNSGVDLHFYRPLHYLRPTYSNQRTHRKILIIDGALAFTGGPGFAHAWQGNAQNAEHWRDTNFSLTGPAVAKMQKTFAQNWRELTAQTLRGPNYYPSLKKTGTHLVQLPQAGSDSPSVNLQNDYLAAINSARKTLHLQQAYFIPTKAIVEALIRARQRNVSISLILPGTITDSKLSRYASQNNWRTLLQHGVRLYQYQPTMMHAKILISDSLLTLVGSANIDPRSFYLNDENNLHVASQSFARRQIAIHQNDLKSCREITLKNLPQHLAPAPHRWFAYLIQGQL